MTAGSRSFAAGAVVDHPRDDVSASEVKPQEGALTQPVAPWPAWIQRCGTGLASEVPPKLEPLLVSRCSGDHPAIQAKLMVGPPDDRFEREAERVADAVVQ